MATKREWLQILKAIKKEPRELLPAECDELILLLGGTVRPPHRPVVKVFGVPKRRGNWTAIAGVVFGSLENAEEVARLESEIQELSSPDFMKKYLAELPGRWKEAHASKMTAKQRAEAVRITEENLADAIAWRKGIIARLRPIAAKNRATAERMAVEWFAARGIKRTKKQIQNELEALRQAAGLKRLDLAAWRKLKKEETGKK